MKPQPPAATLDELLQHADWVSGLALRLVKDSARADDLVQEAWVAAIESPPKHAGNLRAWLGSVVTRLAHNQWRGDSRRNQRERSGARAEALPSTDQLVHEAQLSAELATAVAELAEPYKTVLLLRFFRGMKPSAIARELGRPVTTVKTQLQRGVDRLREQLDDRYGDRRAWSLALIPLAQTSPSGLGLAIPAQALWIAPLVVAACWLAAVGIWPNGATPHVEPLQQQAQSSKDLSRSESLPGLAQRVALDNPAPADIEALEQPGQAITALRNPTVFILRGRLLDLAGEPQAGVRLRWKDSGSLSWLDEARSYVTGPGTFVAVKPEVHANLLADPSRMIEFVDRNFRRPDLALALLRDEPAPVHETISDSRGRFEFELPERGYDLRCPEGEQQIIGRSFTIDEHGDRVQTWFMATRRDLSGRVVDERSRPVAGAKLRVFSTFPEALQGRLAMGSGFNSTPYECESDEDGAFRLDGVTVADRFSLRAEVEGIDPQHRFFELDSASTEEINFVYGGGNRSATPSVLEGRILLDTGSPAARATVVCGLHRVQTDLDGRYALRTREQHDDLIATRSGCGVTRLAAPVEGWGSDRVPVADMRLPRESKAIEGLVLDEGGLPIEGVLVHLVDGIPLPDESRQLEDLAAGRQLKAVSTDHNGRFRVDGLEDRGYVLRLELGSRSIRCESIAAGTHDLSFVLP